MVKVCDQMFCLKHIGDVWVVEKRAVSAEVDLYKGVDLIM
jgi:hypothetical protein